MFSKNTLLNFFIISFLISILVNNYLQDFLLSFYVFLAFSLIYFNVSIYKKSIKKYILLFLMILIGNISGTLISTLHIENIRDNISFLEKQFLRKYDYEFKVKDLYKKYDFYNTYIVQIYKIGETIVDKNIDGVVYLPSNLSLEKGQYIATNSQIINVDNIDNNFDYKSYLLSKNIYFKSYLYNHKIIKEEKNILTTLSKYRKNILNVINKIYPKDEATFLSGILIGARENIPKSLNESFNDSGTTHLVAVSGFNITILIIFLGFFIKFMPIVFRTIAIVSFLVVFCLFVGLEASVIRAGIMGILGYFIMISGRKNNSITILLLTSFFMILYNPYYINYDVSFQLSFLAVLGILYTKDYFYKIFSFLPNTLAIRDSFSITLSAMTLTLPIMMFNFGQVSLLAPISNLLIVWNIPLIMIIGFLSIIGYYIYSILGITIGLFAFVLLRWDLTVIKYFGNLDKFIIKFDFGDYALYLEVLYFFILGFIIILNKKRD
ncbi:hypothetical protein EOM39_04720 [Candidatus Gracilibacteria bacterium]|nr:hypothetical protein [Candidatus Gracilibacteria bacterium]